MRCKFSADSGILKVRGSVRFGKTAAVTRSPKEQTRSWSTFLLRSYSRQIRKGRSSTKTSTKYWIYALVINPITTLIIYYMFNAGFNLLNLIGVGIIGYGIFLYFVVQAIRIDVRARQAYKKKKGKGGKKKKKR